MNADANEAQSAITALHKSQRKQCVHSILIAQDSASNAKLVLACIRGWSFVVRSDVSKKKQRTRVGLFAHRAAAQLQVTVLTRYYAIWRICQSHRAKERMCTTMANKGSDHRAAIMRHSHFTAELRFKICGFVIAARALIRWRYCCLWHVQMRLDSRRQYDTQARHRGFIIRLRGRLYQQSCLLSWLRILPIKPYEAPAWKRVPEFLKDPPAIYVRPVTRTGAWHEAPGAAMIEDTQCPGRQPREPPENQAVAMTVSSRAAGTDSVQTLAPGERFLLANQAMTSDVDYKRLLEHNRREIRDGPDARGTAKVTGWGVWMN